MWMSKRTLTLIAEEISALRYVCTDPHELASENAVTPEEIRQAIARRIAGVLVKEENMGTFMCKLFLAACEVDPEK